MMRKPCRPLRYMVMLVSCLFVQALFTTIGCANSSVQYDALLKSEYAQLIRNERVDYAALEADSESARAATERTVYLTFDDGPSIHTEKILDILADEQIPATFFVLGERVERAPDTVSRIIEEGHALGNHSYNHRYEELYSSFGGFWEQLLETEALIHSQTLTSPTLVRAPGGTFTNFDAFYYQLLSTAGYTVVDWNVDSGDSKRKGVTAQEIIDNIKRSVLHERAVVLLHDGPGHSATVEALPEIIAYYREQGYTFAALDDRQPRPVQFRIGSSKWEREPLTFAQYKHWMKTMTDHQADKGDRTAQGGQAERVEQGPYRTSSISTHIPSKGPEELAALASSEAQTDANKSWKEDAQASPALQITVNGLSLSLESGQYRFQRDRFAVPFSFVSEYLSGRLPGYGEGGNLLLQTFSRQAVFEPEANLIIVDGLNGFKQHYISDVFIEDGEVYVGLRMAAEWLGYTITGFTIGGENHQVILQKNIIALPFEV
ncbi:polysaccharide deacetylase [Paenibacillus senegalensis]|uniref:polysaccharide deacetylase n=1 Tax=Paenibacillus senegalensis TaxID=1465766 RepID=UPI0003113CB9|nr:polysaccharide deacetylase [Paenibacillus senegalensis]